MAEKTILNISVIDDDCKVLLARDFGFERLGEVLGGTALDMLHNSQSNDLLLSILIATEVIVKGVDHGLALEYLCHLSESIESEKEND